VSDEHPFTAWWLHPRRQRWLADAIGTSWAWVHRMGTAGAESRRGRRFGAVGEGTGFMFPPGPCMNEQFIRLGERTLIGPEVSLSAGMWPGERLEPEAGWVVRIGDRVNIGRRCSIVGRIGIDIGDDVTFAPDVYVTDHNHRYDNPSLPVATQWVDSAPVSIGAGCWLGTQSVILPGTTLGRNVVVAAGTVVRGDVPDHAVVAGVPGWVVRRLEDGTWDPPLRDDIDPAPPGWPGT
jgi:serine acetyltransferase